MHQRVQHSPLAKAALHQYSNQFGLYFSTLACIIDRCTVPALVQEGLKEEAALKPDNHASCGLSSARDAVTIVSTGP
eukprot:scaffold1093_cov359-Prasinococcus_capsulatus_cf.AAC.15